jgi:hypothetical protein
VFFIQYRIAAKSSRNQTKKKGDSSSCRLISYLRQKESCFKSVSAHNIPVNPAPAQLLSLSFSFSGPTSLTISTPAALRHPDVPERIILMSASCTAE